MRGSEGFARILLLVLLALLAAGAFAAYTVSEIISAPGPQAEKRVVWIERGDYLQAVEAKLRAEGLLSEDLPDGAFYYYGRATGLGEDLRAGEFVIPADASVKEIAATLRDAEPLLRFVTIPEGVTTKQALRLLGDAPVLTGEITREPGEGALLPETYAYERGESRDAVLKRMEEAQATLLDELWPGRAENLPFETKEDAVILASVVEKETAVASERGRVASVFVNRLRRGMRLQSDPTIIYGITGGEPLGRGIRRSELDNSENPYNTYRRGGLPPTPIANPGRESIAAVLNPQRTSDLYFVADGTGGHAFAATLREHNANVARWRAIERARRDEP